MNRYDKSIQAESLYITDSRKAIIFYRAKQN
ncbi:hypothetical protein HDF26_002232 [Pedobacter cryoconitis]|uniref:Uncharacterized protein n=1 Tax=Pedobacter cryoconitis TaxID=188932 RepID=A0A7W8ZJ67_9SPHI|nr:hypothetical protein [Pedobacter cryoconitis]MBB6271775.1 hypothetical protein [Pedobacter cryoconitis]